MEQEKLVREIPVTEMKGLRIGNAQDDCAKTGVTVLLFDQGAKVGVDVSGGGPASRETHLASPVTADNPVNAIVLSGGSAYGLAAGDGVMRYLEEHGIGFDTGYARVPLVCQSCIYDLGYGSAKVRPDAGMGYRACVDAGNSVPVSGNTGAGTGATVGKLYGMERSVKAGLGIHAVAVGALQMAAVVVVNALGDIYDPKTGQKVAGLRSEDGLSFVDTCQELYKISRRRDLFTGNTTIGAVVTNGSFSKAEMSKIASMTRNAYARCINPVGTLADGDTIYAASLGEVEADINMAGTLAAEVMAEAILKAVYAVKEQ
ncbi:MAG: P1 family peptidase [Clostridiales bacterium]|nr:P1 family peptidase [Clostridiales bacterium]